MIILHLHGVCTSSLRAGANGLFTKMDLMSGWSVFSATCFSRQYAVPVRRNGDPLLPSARSNTSVAVGYAVRKYPPTFLIPVWRSLHFVRRELRWKIRSSLEL